MKKKPNERPQEYKTCGAGKECVAPNGPTLPITTQFWYFTQDGNPRKYCKECDKSRRKAYHQINREQENKRSRVYAKSNPEKIKDLRKRYRIRKKRNGGTYTHSELDTLYKQQKGCCWYCGDFVGLTFSLDHRIPVSRGGSSDISNLVICCEVCNKSKGDKLPHEWSDRLL